MASHIGIDFGTTNSAVCIWGLSGPSILSLRGQRITPSLWYRNGAMLETGLAATKHLHVHPERTVRSIKRIIGRKYTDQIIAQQQASVGYQIVPHKLVDAEPWAGVLLPDETTPTLPTLIAADILRPMLAEALRAVRDFTGVTVTFPAHFSDLQRQSIIDAVELCGIDRKIINTVSEPTAAALAYSASGIRGLVCVFDLGGGTFDTSLVRIDDEGAECVGVGGDQFLGGDDFDVILASMIARKACPDDHDPDAFYAKIMANPLGKHRLLLEAEEVKRILSDADAAEAELPSILYENSRPIHIRCEITRDEYEAAIAPLIERTLNAISTVITQSGIDKSEIDGLIFVGGMTRTPCIREAVEQYLGLDAIVGVNPDEAVAIGAYIYASNRKFVADIMPHAIGIIDDAGAEHTLIVEQTSIPTTVEVLAGLRDGQTDCRVQVFQSDGVLGSLICRDMDPGLPVRIELTVTASGEIGIAARQRNGVPFAKTLRARTGLSATQIKQMTKQEQTVSEPEEIVEVHDVIPE